MASLHARASALLRRMRFAENFRSVPQLAIDELLEAKTRVQKALKLIAGEPAGAGQAASSLNQAVKYINDGGDILYRMYFAGAVTAASTSNPSTMPATTSQLSRAT